MGQLYSSVESVKRPAIAVYQDTQCVLPQTWDIVDCATKEALYSHTTTNSLKSISAMTLINKASLMNFAKSLSISIPQDFKLNIVWRSSYLELE